MRNQPTTQEIRVIPSHPLPEDPLSAVRPLSAADVLGASALVLLAFPILLAYLLERAGFTIQPNLVLAGSLAAVAVSGASLSRRARWNTIELAVLAAVVLAFFGWAIRLAWPSLLPVGGGVDLTHHLLLIDYIERHWRLVHDPAAEAYLGEMVHYTPGSQLLAALLGAWTRTDGLHSVYAMVAASVAIKAGLVFLIAARTFAHEKGFRIPLAVAAVVFLFVPYAQLFGSFTHDSFFAQVLAELFAVGAWWSLILWTDWPSLGSMGLFATSVSAAFLTWPVWIGPPLLALPIAVLSRRGVAFRARLGYLAAGGGPPAVIVLLYVIGRLAWVGYVRAGGALVDVESGHFGWMLLVAPIIGLAVLATRGIGRITVVFAAAIGLQAFALFKLNEGHGPGSSYMALKMIYLAIYPMAVAAAACLAAVLPFVVRMFSPGPRVARGLAWACVCVLAVVVGRAAAGVPKPKPVVTEPLNLAGTWARSHLDPRCVDYLVADDYAAYWLHLAVLRNPRISRRTEDTKTFELQSALERWVTGTGPPYGIAELTAVPTDVQQDFTTLARFGPAAVVARGKNRRCPE